MEITRFLRKYIDLMRYDMLHNSLPFVIFILIYIFVEINMFIVVLAEPENLEQTLLTVVEVFIKLLLVCNIIKRNLNDQQTTKLLELIEGDFAVSQYELTGRDDLWLKIHNYYKTKRKHMIAMSRNLAVIFIIITGFMCNRNVLNYLFDLMTDAEDESNSWPTPYLTYCPSELKSPLFFIYTYSLHFLVMNIFVTEGFFIINSVRLSTERILADFDTLIMLLDDLVNVFPDLDHDNYQNTISQANQQQNCTGSYCIKKTENLKRDLSLIIHCHQILNRNFKVCADGSGCMISIVNLVIMFYCCTAAYLMLTTNDFKKKVNYAATCILVNITVFSVFHNGQRIFNQNDILRRRLAELPWTDKPQWFKQSVQLMMTRANVDIEMRPYGIYTLNYMSFKDLMKTAFSIGNILYTKKLRSQTQQ